MEFSYDGLYVGLSFVIAIFASDIALALASGGSSATLSVPRTLRLVGGSFALAAGVWATYFVCLLALNGPFEVPLRPWPTLMACGVALLASALSLSFLTSAYPTSLRIVGSGLLLGCAISAMRYPGVYGLDGPLAQDYNRLWLLTSCSLAVTASICAMGLSSLLTRTRRPVYVRWLAAAAMGAAIGIGHYSGMEALPAVQAVSASAAYSFERGALVTGVSIVAIAALAGALALGRISSRVAKHERESSRLQRVNRELALKAHTDSLTGLPNREALEQHIAAVVEDARTQEMSFWTLFLDLDGFKAVNDTYGHLAGDILLKEVAARLSEAVRHTDKAFRVSGDEFVVVTGISDADEHVDKTLASRILAAVREPYVLGPDTARVTVSIGMARFPDNGHDARSLLLAADGSMYAAKKDGKNQIRVGTEAFNVGRARPKLILALEQALENEQLELVYQPIVRSFGRTMPGVEALLRWNHPELGVLSAGQFFPQAEAFGLSNALGAWALEQAASQISRSTFDEPTWVTVNLAAAQIHDAKLPLQVEQLLNRYALKPHQLGLEITESMSMLDIPTSSGVLRSLQELGLSITMDDFGTGYSSLAQLHRLPVDMLKVDRTFIENLGTEQGPERIVEAILAMSKALGLRTVAEGVETSKQFEALCRMGVDMMQGYGVAKPMAWAGLQPFATAWKAGKPVS